MSALLAARYVDQGHVVKVMTCEFEDAPRAEVRTGYEVSRLRSLRMPRLGSLLSFDIRFAARPTSVRRLFKELDDFAPDVLHIHGQFMDLAWIGSFYARRRGLPVLLSVHTRLESPRTVIDWAFRVIDRILVRPLIAMSRPSVVVMDKLMGDYIVSRYRIPTDRRIPIPVGIDIATVPPTADSEALRRKYLLTEGPIILSVGHVIALRDRLALVRALPAILQGHPDAQLVVAGSVEYPAFLAEAETLGVSHAVKCLGRVPKHEIPDLFSIATVEAHDLQGYGMGTANFEAMAYRVPTVVAVDADNFPGIRLQTQSEVCLVAANSPVDISRQVIALLDDHQYANSIGEAGRRLVERHFSIESVVDKHIVALKSLMSERL